MWGCLQNAPTQYTLKVFDFHLYTLPKVVARRAIKTLAKCSDAKVILRLFGQPRNDVQ